MEPLWTPSEERIRDANITLFIDFVNRKYSLDISGYHVLYQWSIDDRADFRKSM